MDIFFFSQETTGAVLKKRKKGYFAHVVAKRVTGKF
jgi:hypothetical protein